MDCSRSLRCSEFRKELGVRSEVSEQLHLHLRPILGMFPQNLVPLFEFLRSRRPFFVLTAQVAGR